jgi:RNA polymerase sigma-70 factor (ECF subfamily)
VAPLASQQVALWVRAPSPRAPDWVAWVLAARRGERTAFAQLHARFRGLVHAIVIAKVPAADAADLTQDVFVTMLQLLDTLEDDRAFPAWLMQLARHRALKFLRDARQHAPLDEATHQASPDCSGRPDTRKVLAALQSLPEAYAETLAMRLLEGLTGPEISERTGLSPGSVRVNLHRGMVKLRAALGLIAPEGPADD